MMDSIGRYSLSILVAVITCSILSTIVSNNKCCANMIRMLCGIYITITVVSPLLTVKLDNFIDYWDNLQVDAEQATQEGVDAAVSESAARIKKDLQSYIIERAESLGVSIDAEVIMTSEFPPVPKMIEISGSISPYNRKILSEYIVNEIGIPEESQIWK